MELLVMLQVVQGHRDGFFRFVFPFFHFFFSFFFFFLPLKAPRWARYEPNPTGSSQEWFPGHSPSSSWSGAVPIRRHTAVETPRAGGLGVASAGGDGSIPPSPPLSTGPHTPSAPSVVSSCSHHAATTQMSPLPPLSPPVCGHLLLSEVKVSLVPWCTSAPKALLQWDGPPRREGAHPPWHVPCSHPCSETGRGAWGAPRIHSLHSPGHLHHQHWLWMAPARATGTVDQDVNGMAAPPKAIAGAGSDGVRIWAAWGLLSAAHAVLGALRPAPCQPLQSCAVCVPAINIDGADAVQVCLYTRCSGCECCTNRGQRCGCSTEVECTEAV